MMRITGVNIPDDKKIKIALTYIFGVGQTLAEEILGKADVDQEKRAKDLSSKEVSKVQKIIEEDYVIEGELRQKRKQNINRLKNIDSYRGKRHSKDLPVRGQRTKTNSRTVRGNVRKTAGSGRHKVELK
ncbi:MAG TPA: 30S ribosomal protein S13 [Candidatus Paceibacterota bacterium]|nr:30S ribosomal protein S13 [Candidatus Paceibacterota bacterium]